MTFEKIPYKIYLTEDEMPMNWYNVRADMKTKPAPLLNPATGTPMGFDDLRPVFCDELIRQELDNDTREIPIPQEIREKWYPEKDYHTLYIGEIVEVLQK